jgi:catechol 2,3-dioxygenase-like lactoylglutathione lyase family enzyme
MNTFTAAAIGALATATLLTTFQAPKQDKKDEPVALGNFSVSLTVKDINASKAFYEKLGFKQVAGKLEQRWVVMQNGAANVGLFQGFFDRNSLTFNPGWDFQKNTLKDFQDVRELQRIVKQRGLTLKIEAKDGDGPASFALDDPDGNPILVDQHVAKPKK